MDLKVVSVPFADLTTVHDVIDYASNWGNCPKKAKIIGDLLRILMEYLKGKK